MKTCLRCETALPLSAFHSRNHTSKYTGVITTHYTSYCKACNKVLCKERRQSIAGLIECIYNGQLQSSKARRHTHPEYTKEELDAWLIAQPAFPQLYAAWVASGFDKWNKPSVDRLNEQQPYTFNNIRLITWAENAQAFKQKKVDLGVGDCKAVQQYSDGLLINTFHSLHEAARQTGAAPGNILRCCRGEYATSKGFVWRYVNA